MLRKTSPKWFDERGYFTGKSVAKLAQAICEITGFNPRENLDCVKLENHVLVFFVAGTSLYKVKIPCHVIYCLKDEDIEGLINSIKEFYV